MAKRSLKEVKVVDPEVVEEEVVRLDVSEPKVNKVVTGSSLNFREAPSITAKVLSVLSTLTVLEVIDTKVEGWFHVKNSDGKTGYVMSQFVKEI
jgi:uncharacterized protein YgiM (DUF1202 family)